MASCIPHVHPSEKAAIPSQTGHSSPSLSIEQPKPALLEKTSSEGADIVNFQASIMGSDTTISMTSEQEAKLMRRIDWHLLPLLSIMYMIKILDYINVSNARIMDQGTNRNILAELNITPDQYNFLSLAYCLPYIIAEVPCNLVFKYFKPSVSQSRILISWGVVLCLHATVRNAAGLYTVRAFLGLFEAGLFPGIVIHMCYWYRPDEMGIRLAFVTILGQFSTIIGGILAFAFDGVFARGISGWRWLVITEGVFTILLGIAVFLLLPDFPSSVSWLTDTEKVFVQDRLPLNSPRSSDEDFSFQEFIGTLKDLRLWLFLLCWIFYTVGTTGLTFYQPTVIANLGFTSIARAQLLNIPPAIISIVVCVISGVITNRGLIPQPAIPLACMVVILASYAVLFTFPSNGAVYAATAIAGGFSAGWDTMMWPWRVQTTSGATGSAFAIAFVNSYGQIGGAVGPQLFSSRFAPRYRTSFAIAMGLLSISILVTIITWMVTGRVEKEIRRQKRARLVAAKSGEALM
ncbi:major facilitator superfamily domain-containing protein [Xylaria telfairii]|nr:major facilitator superfamily domain-containing protein [Xylaria telfairii]